MFTLEERRAMIERLRRFPDELEALVDGLDERHLRTAFIPGEWSVAQIVHHLADAHMNAFIRTKLMLTEDNPTFKPYDQDTWALTPDYTAPISESLLILRGLHARWCALFENLTDEQIVRPGLHPELGPYRIDLILQGYNRHCDAHLDQIQRTLAVDPQR